MNASAQYLSAMIPRSSVEQRYNEAGLVCMNASTRNVSGLKLHLVSISIYLNEVSVDHLDNDCRLQTGTNSKTFAVWSGSVLRRACGKSEINLSEACEGSDSKTVP